LRRSAHANKVTNSQTTYWKELIAVMNKAVLFLFFLTFVFMMGCGAAKNSGGSAEASSGSVTVQSPQNGAAVTSPARFVASASASNPIAQMGINVDSKDVYTTAADQINTQVQLTPGPHSVVVKAWDSTGKFFATPLSVSVPSPEQNQVIVSAPVNEAKVSSPVNFAASASSPNGVASMTINVDSKDMFSTESDKVNTSLPLASGSHNVLVKAWDNKGGYFSAPLTVNVADSSGSGGSGGSGDGGSGSGGSQQGNGFYNLQASGGWTGFGQLAPSYEICGSCKADGSQVSWGMQQGVSSPSLSGSATKFSIGGDTPFSDVLWNKHLIGDGSGKSDNGNVNGKSHNFVYDVYFYMNDPQVSQALEFDINQFVNGKSFIWGHECRLAGGNEWDVWDNPGHKWVSTGISCKPKANDWNHLVLTVQRTSDDHLLFQSIELNGDKATLNRYDSPTSQPDWYGITVNYQMDGNASQQDYSVWLDKFDFIYW